MVVGIRVDFRMGRGCKGVPDLYASVTLHDRTDADMSLIAEADFPNRWTVVRSAHLHLAAFRGRSGDHHDVTIDPDVCTDGHPLSA
jgi:hypothetical protein